MKPDKSDVIVDANLAALSMAVQGRAVQGGAVSPATETAEDSERNAKIAELKAKFEAGTLPVDEPAIASKLVDLHVHRQSASQK